MATDGLIVYFEALERLKIGKPIVVSKGTKITHDAVSLEAGRKKGSIKKSRPVFSSLIMAIEEAATQQIKPRLDQEDRLTKVKNRADNLQEQLDAALSREMSLVYELFELKKKLAKLTGEKIVPIRKIKEPKNGGSDKQEP